jgi:hypothetical protein
MTKYGKSFTAVKLFYILWIENYNLIILRPPKRHKSYKRSLQPSKENIEHFKTLKFFTFLYLWVIFALLNPDPEPASQINVDPCGSGSTTLLVGTVPYRWSFGY